MFNISKSCPKLPIGSYFSYIHEQKGTACRFMAISHWEWLEIACLAELRRNTDMVRQLLRRSCRQRSQRFVRYISLLDDCLPGCLPALLYEQSELLTASLGPSAFLSSHARRCFVVGGSDIWLLPLPPLNRERIGSKMLLLSCDGTVFIWRQTSRTATITVTNLHSSGDEKMHIKIDRHTQRERVKENTIRKAIARPR